MTLGIAELADLADCAEKPDGFLWAFLSDSRFARRLAADQRGHPFCGIPFVIFSAFSK